MRTARSIVSGLFALAAGLLQIGCEHGKTAAKPGDPQLVSLDGEMANRYVKADEPSELVARLKISALGLDKKKRPPINVALVVDTSGSMEGKSIADARAAAHGLLDALGDGDFLAIVAFNTRAEVLVPSTLVRRKDKKARAKIAAAIDGMVARGTTDLAGGLAAGLAEAQKNFQPQGVNRIVLLGDGVPNDPAMVVPYAQSAGSAGIAISALGLGLEYDETMMQQIAQVSGGAFRFLRESSEVAQILRDEVSRLHGAVARNVSLTLTPGPGVTIVGIAGQPPPGAGAVVLTLGDLSGGEQHDVVLRVKATKHRAGVVVEMVDAVLSFDDAATSMGRFERRAFLSVRTTPDAGEIEKGRNAEIERSAAHAENAHGILQAIAMARMGDVYRAQNELDRLEAQAGSGAIMFNAPELREQAARIKGVRNALPEAVSASPSTPAATVVKSLHNDSAVQFQNHR